MKRLLTCVAAAAALVTTLPASAALNVFACEAEWGALAAELGGSDAEVYTATSALQDVHKIQARPSLIAQYRKADLLVCTGAELEIGWLPALAQKGNNPRLSPGAPGYFEASSHVEMRDVPATLDRAQGVEIAAKCIECAQDSFAVGEEDVVPHDRVTSRDSREIAETAGSVTEDLKIFIAFGQ